MHGTNIRIRAIKDACRYFMDDDAVVAVSNIEKMAQEAERKTGNNLFSKIKQKAHQIKQKMTPGNVAKAAAALAALTVSILAANRLAKSSKQKSIQRGQEILLGNLAKQAQNAVNSARRAAAQQRRINNTINRLNSNTSRERANENIRNLDPRSVEEFDI